MNDFEKYTAEAKEKWGNTDAYKEHADGTAAFIRDAIEIYCK